MTDDKDLEDGDLLVVARRAPKYRAGHQCAPFLWRPFLTGPTLQALHPHHVSLLD
jgi:hypothetical protein